MGKLLQFPIDRIKTNDTVAATVETTTSLPAGLHVYHPEMGEKKPKCQIEAGLSHDGKHYFIDTTLELRGRGIEFLQTYKTSDFIDINNRRVGWHHYKVTTKAFEKIKAEYSVSYEMLLD